MQSIIHSKADRTRAQNAALTKHYRAIGPAAVAAALIFVRKATKKSSPKTA